MQPRGHEGESANRLAPNERTRLRLLPRFSEEPGIWREPTIDPPPSSAGGRAAGAGAEPVGSVPPAAPSSGCRAGVPSERRTPALTVTQCQRTKARVAVRA